MTDEQNPTDYPKLVKAVEPELPPPDVPLDQTAAPMHVEGDLSSV